MRTFIAIKLSEEIKKEMASLQEKLKPANADVKWVNPENIHLTLKFLGEVKEDRITKIKDILENIAKKHSGFEISLFKLGAFPKLDYPRVVWAGIDKGCSEAEAITKEIEENLENLGFEKEKRPFSAHLTLGRVKSGKNKEELKKILLSLEAKSISCKVEGFILFQSTLTPKGPIYRPLHVFNLKRHP